LNILTKISIVVVAVLVLVACPVFIRMAVAPYNYRKAYEESQLQLQNAVAAANVAQLGMQAAQAQLAHQVESQRSASDDSAKRVNDLQNRLSAADVRVAELQASMQAMTASLTELKGTLSREVEQRIAAVLAREKDREAINRLQAENQHLESSLKEAEGNIASLTMALRSMEEQNAQLKEMNLDLQKGGAAPTAASASGAESPSAQGKELPKIAGAVTAVDKEIVSINVGSAKGVKEGMVMIIYRGDQIVAHLRVQLVDANQAAGVAFDKQRDPLQGDKVATRSSLR